MEREIISKNEEYEGIRHNNRVYDMRIKSINEEYIFLLYF